MSPIDVVTGEDDVEQRNTANQKQSVCLKVILLQQAGLVRWAALIRWRTDMIDGMISRTCQPAESFLTHLRGQVH